MNNIPLLGKPSPIKKYNQLTTLLRKYCAYKSYVPALRSVQFNDNTISVYDLETQVTLNLATGINAVIEFDDFKKLGSTPIDDYEANIESTYKLVVTQKKDFDYLETEESFEFKTQKEAEDHLATLEVKSSRTTQTDYLVLKNDFGKIVLSTIDQSELPKGPDVGEASYVTTWPLETLQQIELVVGSVSTNESRPVFQGINLSCNNGILEAACADGFMLLKNEIVVEGNFNIIVPALQFKKALEGFKRVKDDLIKFEIFDQWLRLTGETMTWTQKLIEGEFPNWRHLLPSKKESYTEVHWGRSCLQTIKNILQAYPHLRKYGGPGVHFSNGKAEIQGSEAYIPTQGQVEYKLDLTMEGGSFRLNPVMVRKVLEAFGETDGRYIYREGGVVNPIVFERDQLLGLIMPMSIK